MGNDPPATDVGGMTCVVGTALFICTAAMEGVAFEVTAGMVGGVRVATSEWLVRGE